MMDRNYPAAPTFPDPLASVAAASSAQPATAWAYEGGASSNKPSLSYGGGHPSHSEADLHRQTYTTSHQLPAYATTPHPTGLSGIFDSTVHSGSSNTKETSVMNFLTAIDSRNAQAVSSGTTLLPQFRGSTWQPGIHSSTAAELFVTGALPASGTFPAASVYQHPTAYSSRNFATVPSLTLQDAAFSATSNGLLTNHDSLLQIKTSQGTIPTALTFERLGNSVLSTSMPPQSSTYRSAQESAAHLLQPQFSLLPSSLGGAQQAPQVYSSSLFTGTTASIERALQRECSVIKHHQRPSSTQSVQAQLTGSQHSLHNYLSSANVTDFSDTSQQSSISCSPVGDATQVSNGGPQQKTSQVTVELAQSYTSAIPSPGFPSVSTAEAKQCSTKEPPRVTKTPNSQSIVPTVQIQSYSKTAQSQSSVIASQAQIYSTAHLPSLLSVSQSQNYISTPSQNIPSISHAQAFPAIKIEKLPPLYKTLPFSGQSQAITSDSQTLSYSDQQVLSSVSNNNYSGQTRDLSSGSQSQNYSSSHSQGLTTVSQSQISYSSQSQDLSVVSPSETYTTGPSLTLTSQSLPFSSSAHVQNLSSSSPPHSYISLHSQAQESSSPQSQKFLAVVQTTPFAMPAQSQSLQNRSSSNAKSYMKRKSDPNLYQASKQDDHFQMQDLQVLQQQTSLDSTTQRITDGESDAQGATYKVSKVDNPYSQSVIRSNSRLEEQVVGLTLHRLKKDERMISSVSQLTQQIGHISNVTHDVKKGANLMQTTQVNVDAKELNQQHSLLHKVHEVKASEQQGQIVSTPPHLHTQAIRHGHQLCLSGAQVLLESACDLQMLQPSILQSGLGTTKISPQVQAIQSPQQVTHQFLQVDSHMAQSNGRHSQQQLHPQSAEIISEPTKPLQQHFTSKDHFVQPNHEPKNQFVSLSTVCFPESMLLNDDRNILSNVDDILAATAAACGVTPTEFAKVSPNEEEIQSIESGDNSKSQFQTVDARHVTPNFSSTPTVVGKPLSINNISLNGGQVTLSLTAVSTMQPNNLSLDQQHIETPDQSIPTRLATSELEQRPEQVSGLVKHQSSNSNDSEGKNLDSTLNVKDSELVSSGRTLNKERVISNNNFNIESDNTVIGNSTKIPFQPILSMQQPGDENGSKTQEERQDILQEDLQRQKDKGHSKTRCVNEDDTNPKQQKRTGQCRPQNSRGADASLQYSSPVAESCYETYQHQEKMRQKIKEVEEKQPEVKTGFIGSFLDFLKSGARQQFSAPAIRMPNRMRRPVAPVIRAPCTHFLSKPQMAAHSASLENGCENSNKKGNKEPKRNSEALPSFSSDEDSVGANQDLQKSITSALSTLDDTSEKKKKIEMETTVSSSMTNTVIKKESSQIAPSVAHAPMKTCFVQPEEEGVESGQLAKPQVAAAIEGCTEEENGESGGEGMYRDRDEFVVKIEDIDALQVTLKTGREPPAIWKVQKALLQKFVPEVRNGQREFTATNSYLGYFGDAKSKYKRVYVKILENSNKKECVRICSKRPRNKPLQSPRPSTSISKVPDTAAPKPATVTTKVSSLKPKAKQPKTKAEPPPKKRKTWKEEFPSSPQRQSDEDDTASTTPFVARFLNTRAMKETFRSYMELLVSMALDPDTMQALEKSNDELLLPHMRKIDSMLNENRKRLLSKLHLERSFKAALESFPELTVIHRDSKTKSGMSAVSRIKMNGKAYNKKTLKISKATTKLAQEFAVDPEKIPLCSLYHSLHHYKYHMFLRCKVEISSVQKKNADLGQEEIVQYCMKNMKWVEDLFEKFGELLNHVQQKCS
ncbi:glutamine and serine-rich protein 1 isoform X2 [Sphaerodactylus townsendi]|uniref:glutamine and serine-rich protein 1 isoform X2 n=1 Tax=Sphaerodactylus townsendi TaxID=933632 RepID=UPI00202742B6|nr:glutamine and serine-rich protein 1 isoform X2 [Sphaerodactylus townsendi]